jgi:hypothetical protein
LRVARSGRIAHRIAGLEPAPDWRLARYGVPLAVCRALRRTRALARSVVNARARLDLLRREIGYHAFNLYGLALLRRSVPAHALWRSDALGAALALVGRRGYGLALERNPYGYPYNAPGFEVAFALQVFGGPGGVAQQPDAWWVNRQLARTYSWSERMMSRATADPLTLAARLYEACRLRDVAVGAA